ncbi:uncharacterized protein LMH87_007666 [Akanthomyces muscarius]|uniref:Major facilitator superfamily (MFS) profile domain-containing protein n=1 Tax=Akanthomyces muscarius TaxID=2231603 RepID=A0A9W8QKM2_AKAMU|nr:uncharacterized protein LMH87_007666 [Akanthomyces muscarius]KAJ4161639.1 hypothetical protein LMH87_007666 [Akanthomyces muscarius]
MTLVRCHYSGQDARLPLELCRCGAMFGALFWSLFAQVLLRYTSAAWVQRGEACVFFFFMVCSCALAPAAPRRDHVHGDNDEEVEKTPTRQHRIKGHKPLAALADCLLLLSVLLIYAGASMACTFATPLALRAGVAPATAGFVQACMYAAGLVGELLVGHIEHAVSRKWILVALATLAGLHTVLIPYIASTPITLVFFFFFGMFPALVMTTTPLHFLQSIQLGDRGATVLILASSLGFLLGGPICGFAEDSRRGWAGGNVAYMTSLWGGTLALAVTLTCRVMFLT